MLDRWLDYLRGVRGCSPATIKGYRADVERYLQFLNRRDLTFGSARRLDVRSFISYLDRGRLSRRSIARCLSAVRGFHRFLVRHGNAAADPTEGVSVGGVAKKLPAFLAVEQVTRLLDQSPQDLWQWRDLALLETLYATGCRVAEVASLDVMAVDLERRTAMVTGKGGKQRHVFFGTESVAALRSYLAARTSLRRLAVSPALFINRRGERISDRGIRYILSRFQVPGGQPFSPHTFRHSFATHVLDGGADIRVVQELLGHARLGTTQVYTHTSLERLRKVYTHAHPHARNVAHVGSGDPAGQEEIL